MSGLRDVRGGGEVLPCVRMFHGTVSEYLWEDDDGEVHKIPLGEGGEQGDPMMPLLYFLGQHCALEAINREMGANQHLMAFLDDIFLVTMPQDGSRSCDRTREVVGALVHQSPRGQDQSLESRRHQTSGMQRVGANRKNSAPTHLVWRGSDIPTVDQGIRVLGTHWDTQITWPGIYKGWNKSSRLSWTESHPCLTLQSA